MRGRSGRPRGAGPTSRGPAVKVMMNMQSAASHGYLESSRPYVGRRGRGRGRPGRPRGGRGRGHGQMLLVPFSTIVQSTAASKEGLPLGAGTSVVHKRKEPMSLDSSIAPVVKRRKKEFRSDSDDEFSDMHVGRPLMPQTYHKDGAQLNTCVAPGTKGRRKELKLDSDDELGDMDVGMFRKDGAQFNTYVSPVTRGRRKELKLDSDDDFSDIDIGTLMPQTYHKDCSEEQMSRLDRCRLCNKPAVESTPLSTCTTTTKIQMFQKLDKIVSADNLTLRHKQGVLCSRCSRLLNYVDRIEVELGMLKKTIVECIHKKHNLYVPDESLDFDVAAGDEDIATKDFINFQENNSGKDKETSSFTKQQQQQQQTDVQTKTNNSRDAESIQHLPDPYFFAENNTANEIPVESNLSETEQNLQMEVDEDGEMEMFEEYLEPLFDETVIGSHENEANTDVHERLEEFVSGDHGSTDAAMDVGKSSTGLKKQANVSNSQGVPNFHDDLDVRMLIEELTADPQEDGHSAGERSSATQGTKSSDAVMKENLKDKWRGDSRLEMDGEAVFSQSAAVKKDKGDCSGVRREVDESQSEVDQSLDSDSSSQGEDTPSDMKDWDLSDTELLDEEEGDDQSKGISYDADEWEDGDTHSLEKNIAAQAGETCRDTSEKETLDEIAKDSYKDINTENKVTKDGQIGEETQSQIKDSVPSIETSEHVHLTNQESEKNFETETLRTNSEDMQEGEVKEEYESEQDNAELYCITENEKSGTDYETKQEITEVDTKPDRLKLDYSAQSANYVDSKDLEKDNVSKETGLEFEQENMDTDDEDDEMSVEIKWSSDSENDSSESDVEDDKVSNSKALDKLTDEGRLTAKEPNVKMQELREMERSDDSTGDNVRKTNSPNNLQVNEESVNSKKEIDSVEVKIAKSNVEHQNYESLFNEQDTDMRVQGPDSYLKGKETNFDWNILHLNTGLRDEESHSDFKSKETNDIDSKEQKTDDDATLTEEDDDHLREQQENAGRRVQKTDIDMRIQQTDIDMRVQQADTDLGVQETDSAVGVQETNVDVRQQETDDDSREHESDADLRQHESDADLRQHNTDADLRQQETDDDSKEQESDADLRQHKTDADLMEQETDVVKQTDVDMRVQKCDSPSREQERNFDLRQQEAETDLREKDTNPANTKSKESDDDLKMKENYASIGKETQFVDDVEEHIQDEAPKIESLVSSNETVEVTRKEEIKEEQQENINSAMNKDDQLDVRVPEEGDPEIQVLEYSKTEENCSPKSLSDSKSAEGPCAAESVAASSKLISHEKPITDMLEEHLASILDEEPLGGPQAELFGMDVNSITNVGGPKSSGSVPGEDSIVALQTDESMIRMLEEPVTSTQGNQLFADVSDEKSVIIIDEDEDNSQSVMLAGMGLIGRPGQGLPDLCGGSGDVECVDISSD